MPLLWRVGWSVTNRRMTAFYREWLALVAEMRRKKEDRVLVLDTFQMLGSRMDATTDGVHHYSLKHYLLGGPTSKMPMQIVTNMLCST